MKKIKRKITWSLTFFIAISLIFLMGIVIAAQFFVVSRTYLTSDYTKNRELDLKNAARAWNTLYENFLYAGDNEALTNALDRYARENTACCFLLDDTYTVMLASENTAELKDSYIQSIRKHLQTNDVFENNPPAFRIRNKIGFYTRYIAVVQQIPHYGALDAHDEYTSGQTLIFVAVTKEVYTAENYGLLLRYSLFLFAFAAVLSLMLAYVISRSVTKPILRIKDAAQRMSGLDFSEQCDYQSENELGELADSLNYLSAKLDDTIVQLEAANEKLQGDLDIQREIDKMRRSFIASASHEFKTPLTLLRGYLEMMQENRLNVPQTEEAEKVMIHEIDRLDHLVLNLLELSRLESERYALHMTSFDIVGMTESIVETYRPMMEERSLSCRMDKSQAEIHVTGDPDSIRRVIINFLANAIKYSPENGTIQIRIAPEEDNSILFSVFNPCDPIPEAHLAHLWEPFYRVDKARARKTGGNGLGLSICRDILEHHQSSYGVRNTDGGVEFFFSLEAGKDTTENT